MMFVSEPDCANRVGSLVADFEDGNANSRLILTPQGLTPGVHALHGVGGHVLRLARVGAQRQRELVSVSATVLAQIPVDETGVQGPAIRMRYLVNNATQGGRVTVRPVPGRRRARGNRDPHHGAVVL
jgi:hypothetical protein